MACQYSWPLPIVAFVILGSVLEGIPAIVLFGPLLFPIARQVGVHEVHYAMVVILAMGIGLFAPPFGVGYYAACAISRIHPDEGMRPIVGYMVALLIGTLIVAAVPWISIGFYDVIFSLIGPTEKRKRTCPYRKSHPLGLSAQIGR